MHLINHRGNKCGKDFSRKGCIISIGSYRSHTHSLYMFISDYINAQNLETEAILHKIGHHINLDYNKVLPFTLKTCKKRSHFKALGFFIPNIISESLVSYKML